MTDIQDLSSIPCKEENYYEDINCRSPGVSHAPPSVSTPISSGNCREERREDKLIAWVFYARSQAFLPSKSCLCRSQKLRSCSTNAEMSFSSFAIIFFLFFFFNSRGKNSGGLWEAQMLPWSSFGFFLMHLSGGFLCSVQDFHHSLWRGKEHWSSLFLSKRLLLWIEWACKSRKLNKLHLTQCKHWPASKWPCLVIKNYCFSALGPVILQYQSNTNCQNY